MEQRGKKMTYFKFKKLLQEKMEFLQMDPSYMDRDLNVGFSGGEKKKAEILQLLMLEPSLEEGMGWQDSFLRADGKGLPFLCLKAGGSVCSPSYFTIDHRMHYLHQEGRTVFKFAVTNMSDACALIAERNHLDKDNIAWVIPHQANVRIIEAVAHRLELSMDKVMLNIQRYGNTSAGTLPLALWDYEKQLKKGDNLILTAFGAGFTWGAAYVKWAYDGSK